MNQVAVPMLPCFPMADSEDTVTKLIYFGALTYCDKEQQVEAKALIGFPESQNRASDGHHALRSIFILRGGRRDDTQQALATGDEIKMFINTNRSR